MIDHDECETAIAEAMRYGRNGWAEYLSTRCDRQHGHLSAHPETPDPTTAEPKEGAA